MGGGGIIASAESKSFVGGGGVGGYPPPENFQIWRFGNAIFSTCHKICRIDLEFENGKQFQVTLIKITESKENKSIHRLDLSSSTGPGGQLPPLPLTLATALPVHFLFFPSFILFLSLFLIFVLSCPCSSFFFLSVSFLSFFLSFLRWCSCSPCAWCPSFESYFFYFIFTFLLVCIRILTVCCSYVLVCYPYVLVCIRMSSVCTCMYSYVTSM